MKQILRKTLLVLLGGVMCNAAWADNSITLGNTDNSTLYLGAQNRYTLAPNKTLTLTFTNYAGTLNFYNWDIVVVDEGVVYDDTDINQCYVRYRADNFGDGPKFNASYNGCNWNWETFLADVNEATVTLTIEREGSILKYRAVATKSASTYEQNYRTYNVGDGTQDIDIILTIDHSHLSFANATAANGVITDTETAANQETVGSRDNTSPFWTVFSDYYTIAPNGTLNLQFKNFTNGAANPNNWLAAITTDANRSAVGYEEYVVLRSDNYGWNSSKNTGDTSWYTELSNWYDWTNFTTDMEGALVNMYISRSGAEVTLRADITTTYGSTYFEQFKINCGDGSQNIRVFLTTDHGHLNIDNSKTNTGHFNTALISPLGWSTYSSSHALDFTSVSGLEAYMITNHVGNTVSLSKVTGNIPANTGLLLKGTPSTYYDIPIVSSSSTSTTGNLLVACYQWDVNVQKENGKTKYVLSADGSDPVFKKIDTNSATADRGKAYLQFNEVISARELSFNFNDDITGVNEVSSQKEQVKGEYFNIAGQRVAQPTKGLYIVNGKKVVIR